MKRVHLAMWVDVPDDTDPAEVAEGINDAVNDDDGNARVWWGGWKPGPVTLAAP